MPLCTQNVVSGPLASVLDALYLHMDKIAPNFPLSHSSDAWTHPLGLSSTHHGRSVLPNRLVQFLGTLTNSVPQELYQSVPRETRYRRYSVLVLSARFRYIVNIPRMEDCKQHEEWKRKTEKTTARLQPASQQEATARLEGRRDPTRHDDGTG
jgi:hypothetical protein